MSIVRLNYLRATLEWYTSPACQTESAVKWLGNAEDMKSSGSVIASGGTQTPFIESRLRLS